MLTTRWPDSVLIARVLAGRADAFEGLVLRHQRKAHAIARAHGDKTVILWEASTGMEDKSKVTFTRQAH